MTETLDAAKATALRKPFPPESVGKLPKGGAMLDYVGHAAVTDRLLTVDPLWSWEPFALTPDGLPALDHAGNLWIRLTVCGVTRIGVGDGKNAKEVIGDAIRNAAMRFGVALDLWAKENLVEFAQASHHPADDEAHTPSAAEGRPVSPQQIRMMGALMSKAGMSDRELALKFVADKIGRTVESRNDLTSREASLVIDALKAIEPEGGGA